MIALASTMIFPISTGVKDKKRTQRGRIHSVGKCGLPLYEVPLYEVRVYESLCVLETVDFASSSQL